MSYEKSILSDCNPVTQVKEMAADEYVYNTWKQTTPTAKTCLVFVFPAHETDRN